MKVCRIARATAVAALVAGISVAAAACTRNEPATETTTTTPAREGTTAKAPRSDTDLSTAVRAQYYGDDSIRARHIDVEAQNGVVTLRGNVPDQATKERAVSLARGVEGVTNVNDELQVREEVTTTTAREPEPGAGREIGTAGREDARTPGWITTKIQAQYFVNPEVKPWNIDVTTSSGGVVTLEGTVDSDQDKTEAVRIARETEGVTRVEDRLKVAPAGERRETGEAASRDTTGVEPPDAWLTAKIQAKYFLDTDVKGRRIDVDTQNGVVTLTGDVASEAERRQAVNIARNTDGVRDIKDQLRVDTSMRSRETETAKGPGKTGGIERPDAWITTKIQAQYFLDADVKGHQINVDTSRGIVTLKGVVDTAAQKTEAEQIARETEGVRRVVNQLTVGTSGN